MQLRLAELDEFAEQFVTDLPQVAGPRAHVVGLSGDLGAGKTTFVQAVARVLGAGDSVTSPTFVFAQRYDIDRPPFRALVHIDAYRLQPGEAHTIGWHEYLADPSNLVLVEWPERMPDDFPDDAPVLKFTVIDDASRNVEYAKK